MFPFIAEVHRGNRLEAVEDLRGYLPEGKLGTQGPVLREDGGGVVINPDLLINLNFLIYYAILAMT